MIEQDPGPEYVAAGGEPRHLRPPPPQPPVRAQAQGLVGGAGEGRDAGLDLGPQGALRRRPQGPPFRARGGRIGDEAEAREAAHELALDEDAAVVLDDRQ